MGQDDRLLGGLWIDVSVETCKKHCQSTEQCVYYTYLARNCIIHGYINQYSVTAFAPVSIEDCGDKCVEVVYSVPSSTLEINFREKSAN